MSAVLIGHFKLELSDKVSYRHPLYECDSCGSVRQDNYPCPICRRFRELESLIKKAVS